MPFSAFRTKSPDAYASPFNTGTTQGESPRKTLKEWAIHFGISQDAVTRIMKKSLTAGEDLLEY